MRGVAGKIAIYGVGRDEMTMVYYIGVSQKCYVEAVKISRFSQEGSTGIVFTQKAPKAGSFPFHRRRYPGRHIPR
jgi:hypothetical protein